MNNKLLQTLSSSLENTKEHLTFLFKALDGFKNDINFCDTNQGLRPIGSEAILQSEIYHSLRSCFYESFIISREFQPFAKSDIKPKKVIDLAIFNSISSIYSREAIVWLELKMTGGMKYVKEAYINEFNKLLKISEVYRDKNLKIPEVIGNIIFIESPQTSITNSNPDDFLFGQSISSCLEAPDWFKNIFYEALLWREGGRWTLKSVFV